MATTGENIRERRQALGMTQRKLAELTGRTETTIGRWERDENIPTGEHFVDLAAVLQTTVTELWSAEKVKPPDPPDDPLDGGPPDAPAALEEPRVVFDAPDIIDEDFVDEPVVPDVGEAWWEQ